VRRAQRLLRRDDGAPSGRRGGAAGRRTSAAMAGRLPPRRAAPTGSTADAPCDGVVIRTRCPPSKTTENPMTASQAPAQSAAMDPLTEILIDQAAARLDATLAARLRASTSFSEVDDLIAAGCVLEWVKRA